jgi:hypothetical protein
MDPRSVMTHLRRRPAGIRVILSRSPPGCSKIDAALEIHRVHSGGNALCTFPDDRVGEDRRGSGPVPRLIGGLRCSSLPAQIEANPSRRISQARAATRAARAVFLCSAPLVDLGQPNAGLSLPGVRLACAEPGDQLAIFGEALHELAKRSAFLYEEAGRFWFSTHPTLNREADNRAKALPDHEVDAAIVEILREDAKTKAGFHRVHAAPDDPIAIDETASLSLVIRGLTRERAASPAQGSGLAFDRQ